MSQASNLAGIAAGLLRAVRQGRGALLMDPHGAPIELAALGGNVDLQAMAQEYASLLREAGSLTAELSWGCPRSYSLRGAGGQAAFAFAPGNLFLGVEAGPMGLRGQMRWALGMALARIGER